MKNTPKYTPDVIKECSLGQLLNLWEQTSIMQVSVELSKVRGWLMQEIERRNPDGFNAWLAQDFPEDNELRQYVKEGGGVSSVF